MGAKHTVWLRMLSGDEPVAVLPGNIEYGIGSSFTHLGSS
jgi:hypothetical protein